MELELGLKITRTREDVSSSVDFRFSKDPFGPLVLSRETDSRFIIIIHLKGFKKEGIEIDINKEGNRITIRGRKAVEEMVMIRWMAWRKEVELRAFRKVFLIPDIVDLDKIKARFDDDDATLTITMPKRVWGISGFKLEEEEEEERVDFGDVSEVENREEIQDGEEVEEENVQTEKSDEQSEKSETEIQREEEFGEIMEDQERESRVLGGEEKGFRRGLDEEETDTKDDDLEKIQQINEQDNILGFAEEETVGQQDLADSNTESEDSSLRKLPEIIEQENNQEVMKKQVSQVEAKSDDDTESKAADEEQEPDELDRTSKSRAVEKKTTDGDDDDDGASKVQGVEEQHRHNEESKFQEMVEGKGGEEKKKIVKMETKVGDSKEDVDANMGQGLTPDIDRTQVVGEDDIAETETKSEEFDSDEPKADEEDKKHHELVEKKEEGEENSKVRRQSENSSLRKELQETEEQHSKAQKRQEKTSEAETDIGKTELEEPESQTNDEEKEEKETAETEERDSYIPKMIGEQEKIQEPAEEKTDFSRNGKFKEEEEIAEKKTELGDDDISRKVRNIGRRDLDAKEDVDAELGEGFTPKIAETETKVDTLETREEKQTADTETKEQESHRPKILREQEKIQELPEDKTNFSRKVEEEEETAERETDFTGDDIARNVRDIEQRDSDAVKGQEEKDKIHELALEEKVSDGGKGIRLVAETIAENDKSRNVQEIDDQHSDKEDERGNQFQKFIGGEKIVHGEVEDVENEKKTAEVDKRSRDSASEAKEIERKDSDVSGETGKGDTIQELQQENRTTYQNEQEEENEEDEAGRPEKITGTMEQELVNLKNQLEQDNVEDGEKTQEVVEEKIKDCKEEESETKTDDAARKVQGINKQVEEKAKDCKEEEESETKTDDVIRKVRGIKEQEYEPKRDHVSKIKDLVAESEIETECDGLSKVHGSEEHELHEPNIHKERDETRVTGTEEPSGQEKEKVVESMTRTEKDSSTNVQEIKEERPDKPESHEKQYKIQEVVGAGSNDPKKEQQAEKILVKAKLEAEENSSRKVQQIENQEFDESKRPKVREKMQETEEKDKTERRTKTKNVSLSKFQDDEDPELSKTYRKREEDKIQELVEMETSDYREKVKKQDGNEILRSQGVGRPDLDEYERHSEQRNIPQLVEEEKGENISELWRNLEDDSSGKFHEFGERKSYEDWTHETREKRKDFVEDEATGPKDKHTDGEGHYDHKEEQQKEKVIAKTELKTEDESSKKVQEIEKQRSVIQDKLQETEEKDKTRAMEENKIVETRTNTEDGSLRKVLDRIEPESSKPYKRRDEDKIQELVEMVTSDNRGKIKKQDGDDILRNQEAGELDLGELDRHCKQRKIHQIVEDDQKGEGKIENISEPGGKMEVDSSGKFHEFQRQKSYEDWRQEESEEIEDLAKEEATDTEDKHTGGKEEHEEKRYEKVAETKTKAENEINKKIGKNKKPESDKQEGYRRLDKLDGASDREKEEEKLVDNFATEIQETEKEESHESEIHEKLRIVQDFVEDEKGDHEDEKAEEAAAAVENNEKDSLRKLQTIEEHTEHNNIPKISDPEAREEDEERVAEKETKEQEAHVQELEGKTEKFKDDGGDKGKQGKTKTVERKNDDGTVRKIRETIVQESSEKKDEEPEENIEEVQRKETSNQLETEDDSLRKGQEILENDSSNVSKRRAVEQEKIQQLKEVEKREDEEKEEVETKANDGKSKKYELEENEEMNEIRKPMEEKANAPKTENEKEGNEKTAEEEMQDKVDRRSKDQEIQEPYELRENTEHGKILREEEKRILRAESKDDDCSSKENEMERLRGKTKKEDHQELVEIETSYQRKEEKEKKTVGKEETNDEYDSSSKIHEHEEGNSNKVERHGEEKISGSLAKEEASNDEEENRGNRTGAETQIRDDGFEEEELAIVVRHREQDKKQSFVEKDTSGRSKGKKNQETKSRDDSSRKTQDYEKQESHEQKRNYEEQDEKNLGQNCCRNEEDGKENREISEADFPRKSKGIDKRESTEIVERHGNRDNVKGSAEEKMNNQEGENKTSMITEVLEKAEDHESKGPETLRKQDKSREVVQQRLRDNLRDKETAKRETESKDNESRKIHQIKDKETGEEERRKEQGRTEELVEDRTRYCREIQNRGNESEDGNSKKIQEIENEESTEPKRDEIQEPVDRKTSEDDEEELEVEVEDSEEDWEAEIIQEMDSDEDDDKIRQIRRIKLGFRLVGGSALFMSLIVIVIRFVRSKRNIRCYKF